MTNDYSFTNINGFLPQLGDKIDVLEDPRKFKQVQKKPQTAALGQRKLKYPSSPPEPTTQYFYQQNTINHQIRTSQIGQNDDALNQNFETRLKDLTAAKDASIKLNVNVIETWVNDTLSDAEHLDIPGVILKPDHKNPISRYNIDRITLNVRLNFYLLQNSSISPEKVDRIYRSLFVYSIGFYEMLSKTLQNAENKYTILSNIWRVFQILLEYCSKSNYQMMIAKIAKEHRDELERIENQFNEQMNKMADNEKQLIINLDDLRKRQMELERQKEEETLLRRKVEEEFSKNIQNHEEEVQLRLKFESKLNSMHSLHRDLQAKYQRALEDIYALEQGNQDYYILIQQQKSELIDLRSEKVESEAKIVYQSERIKQLVLDHELKLRQVNDLEVKLSRSNAEVENKNLLLKENERQINEMRLKMEANKSIIDGLTSEKNHVQLTMQEFKDQKDQYYEKSERLGKLYEDTFAQMQEYKKQVVGIDEIKKDRDDRIEKLRQEYEELNTKFLNVDTELTKLKVQHDYVSNEHHGLKLDFDSVTDKLKIANKARNDKEELFNDKVKQCLYQQDIIRDKDYQIDKLKKETEKLRKRLIEVEKQNDALEIKKKSLDKQAEIQRKQLLDKIANLNELVSAEKDTREMWINRFEKEQRAHIETNAELLQMKSQLQDLSLKIKNVEVSLNSQNKNNINLKEMNEGLQLQLSQYMANSETFERDLYTKNQLLKNVEDSYKVFNFKLREEHNKQLVEKDLKLEQRNMEYEELRSLAMSHYREIIDLDFRTSSAESKVAKQQKEIASLEKELDAQKMKTLKQIENMNSFKDEAKEKEQLNLELEEQIKILQEENQQLSSEIQNLRKAFIQKEISNANIDSGDEEEDENISLPEQKSIENVQVEVQQMTQGGKDSKTQLFNRGVQTKKEKMREKGIQTEYISALISPNQLQSQYISNSQNKRPRLVSAVNTNNSTMGQSNYNMPPEMSNGGQSSTGINQSHGDMTQYDYNLAINVGANQHLFYDFDRVKSAAHKYRHQIPGPNDTIQEESEMLNQGKSTKMFKRNMNLEDQEDLEEKSLRKTPTDNINYKGSQPQKQARVNSLQGQIKPSQFQNPLSKHKYAFRIKDDDERRNKSSDRTDIMSNGNLMSQINIEMLKSVYEKRVTTKGIQRLPPQIFNSTSSRPGTQPHGFRKDKIKTMNLQPIDTRVDQLFTPSENASSVHGNRILMMSLGTAGGSRPMTKSSDRAQSSKGRASIKALIKGATTRDQ